MTDLNSFFQLPKKMSAPPVPPPTPQAALPPQPAPAPVPPTAAPKPEELLRRFVAVDGLQQQVELNGSIGYVQRIADDARCVVKLRGNAVLSIACNKLAPIPHPDGAWVCRTCKANAYYRASPEAGWTGRKGKWNCPGCSKTPVAEGAQQQRRYSLLAHFGLHLEAGPQDIRLAYKQWLLSAHPDKGGEAQSFAVGNSLWTELL